MKKWISFCIVLILFAVGLLIANRTASRQKWTFYEDRMPSDTAAPETFAEILPEPSLPPETIFVTEPAAEPAAEEMIQPTAETFPPEVLTFTGEEEELLLKLAMAERGDTGCTTCMALVMRTVLNRVASPKFSSTVKGVIYAQDQFTPVMDGSFEQAEPDWLCEKALEIVKQGWDESQGALYYEWCQGESWHSQNLNLLLQHCDTRFYN